MMRNRILAAALSIITQLATLLAMYASVFAPVAFAEDDSIDTFNSFSSRAYCSARVGPARFRAQRCYQGEQMLGIDSQYPGNVLCATVGASCNSNYISNCSVQVSSIWQRQEQCYQGEWAVGTHNRGGGRGLLCARVSMQCRYQNQGYRQCSVYAGNQSQYQERCLGYNEAITAVNPVECHSIEVQCPDPQLQPVQRYRWEFVGGSNHFTGRCTGYHNSGDPSGRLCNNPGAWTTWTYAYAHGGCAPRYAEWQNRYVCRRQY